MRALRVPACPRTTWSRHTVAQCCCEAVEPQRTSVLRRCRLRADIEWAEREGITFGAKLVRRRILRKLMPAGCSAPSSPTFACLF